MKKKSLLIVILFTIISYSQDKVVEIEIKNKRSLTNIATTKNGYQYIKTSKRTSALTAKIKDVKIKCLDDNLNEVFTVNMKGDNYIGNPVYSNKSKISSYGNYYNNTTQLIDSKGEIRQYEPTYELTKRSQLNPIFSFFTDYGYTVIGPKIGRKYYKKKYDDGDVYIYTLKNKDLTTTINPLETIKFPTNTETLTWVLGDRLENTFYLITKDIVNEEKNKNNYHFVSYKYNGKIDKYTSLKINIGNKHFLLSKTTDGPSDYFNSAYGGTSTYCNFFINEKDSTYTAYGFYTDSAKKQVRVGKIEGIFIHKFNTDGKIIWKRRYPLAKTEKEYLVFRTIFYDEVNNTGFLKFNIKKNNTNLFLINPTDGSIQKKHLNFLNDYKSNDGNLNKDEVSNFEAQYYNRDLKKKFLSFKVLKSFLVKSEVKTYIANKKTNNNLYYDAILFDDGSVILKEFNSKQRILKFLKFN